MKRVEQTKFALTTSEVEQLLIRTCETAHVQAGGRLDDLGEPRVKWAGPGEVLVYFTREEEGAG